MPLVPPGIYRTQYFVDSITGALLRRSPDYLDVAFSHRDGGTWLPTEKIMLYMIGDAAEVNPITEARARELEPMAFS
jgi:hypothetical protein